MQKNTDSRADIWILISANDHYLLYSLCFFGYNYIPDDCEMLMLGIIYTTSMNLPDVRFELFFSEDG